jgi:putative PIG3 family NAD(P)H quinone oxidoreductase
MQAVTISFADNGSLALRESAVPPVGSRDIKIRVHASGINRADLLQRRGLYPPPPGVPAEIPGLECAGEVCEVGSDVSLFRPGERVMALLPGAGQAQYAVVDSELAMPVPVHLSWAEAAAIPEAFATAYDALFHHARLQPGETILIHAVGSGVGTAALQLSAFAGAGAIYGTTSRAKLGKAKELGLTCGIDYHSEEFAQTIAAREPQGVHVIIDLIGASYWQQNIACLSSGGRLVLLGLLGGAKLPANTTITPILSKRLTIIGTVLRSRRLDEKVLLLRELRRTLCPLFAGQRLKPVVDRTFAAEEVAEAYRYVESKQNFGKVVLLWQ